MKTSRVIAIARRLLLTYRNRCTIGLACAKDVALRGAPTTARRHVSSPRRRPPPHLAADNFRWSDLSYRVVFILFHGP